VEPLETHLDAASDEFKANRDRLRELKEMRIFV